MRKLLGWVACVALCGCSTTTYEKPTMAFQTALSDFTKLQASYGPTYSAHELAAKAQTPLFLEGAASLVIDTSCVDQAHRALASALPLIGAGSSLDPLYQAKGAMAAPAACFAGVIPAAAPTAVKVAEGTVFDQEAADAEALTDAAACRLARKRAPPSANSIPAATTTEEKKQDLTSVWTALGNYSAGLVQLASSADKKSLYDAEAGASAAIKSDLSSLKDKAFYSSIVDFLFSAFDVAINQARYNALRHAVRCTNAGIVRQRGVLRDAARFQQIAAFDNLAGAFKADADATGAAYNADLDPDAHCPPVRPLPAKTRMPAKTIRWTRACLYGRARTIFQAADSSAEAVFAAHQILLARANALTPILARLEQEAAATNAMQANDPGVSIDAFIAAHRALRDAIVNGDGQFSSVYDSASTLGKNAKAVNDALKPASTTTK